MWPVVSLTKQPLSELGGVAGVVEQCLDHGLVDHQEPPEVGEGLASCFQQGWLIGICTSDGCNKSCCSIVLGCCQLCWVSEFDKGRTWVCWGSIIIYVQG